MGLRVSRTCSRICGNTELWYIARSTPSSLEREARLVPTKMRRSIRSFSRCSRSRTGPWCCMRTQSLFISAKFDRRNETASATVPPAPSYSEPVSGNFDFEAWGLASARGKAQSESRLRDERREKGLPARDSFGGTGHASGAARRGTFPRGRSGCLLPPLRCVRWTPVKYTHYAKLHSAVVQKCRQGLSR